MHLRVAQTREPLVGEIVVPSSKYHAHRALILASLAPGTSRIHGTCDAGHVRHTVAALRRLGTVIEQDDDMFTVHGGAYRPDRPEISVGSSGTTLYFLTGLASLAQSPVTIVGQRYLQRRPIGPLLQSLTDLGVELSARDGCPPISVQPGRLKGGHTTIPGTLSQWVSGLLLLAPFAANRSVITVQGELNERTYVDLTIEMMREFGLHVEVAQDGRQFFVEPGQQARPTTVTLPPDIGSAAFGLAVTALHPSNVTFRGLSSLAAIEADHPEADLLDIVRGMGLPLTRDAATGLARVRHDGIVLTPTQVDCRRVPDMLPVLSVLAAFADGTSVLDNVAHVRLKESDRVSAMLQLNRMGADLEPSGNQLVVHGVGGLTGTDLSSFNDHRVLMSLAVAGTRAAGSSRLTYPHAYKISYPRFLADITALGADMTVEPGRCRPRHARRTDSRAANPADAAAIPLDLWVRRWAAERPEDTAVVEVGTDSTTDRRWTWRELDSRADAAATLLLRLGVRPGEPVAYQLPNCAEFVAVTLAVLRIGAICCPLMPFLRSREMAFALSRSRARVLVIPGKFRGRDYPGEVAALLRGSSDTGNERMSVEHIVTIGDDASPAASGTLDWHRLVAAGAALVEPAALDARRPGRHDRAQLMFTSGTTGEPKGVLHRLDILTRAAAMQAHHLGLDATDRVYVPSPLAHQTGFLYGMWLSLLLGVPQILQPVWDGRAGLAALRRWRGTFVQAATPFLADLVDAAEQDGGQPESLRVFVVTGATVPRALAHRAAAALGTAVCGAWGSTESCLGAAAAPGDDPEFARGTDGRALAGVLLRITSDDGTVLPPGREGNFEVHTPCLFEGYLDHPEWTAATLTSDGWYRTGDLAVIDEAGYVRITGRVRDVINRGGEKIPVSEVEQLMSEHPLVREAAVVAMPDERLGERACAFVAAEPGFGFSQMQRFLNERGMAKQYWPERLELISALPRNPAGKISKHELRDMARQIVLADTTRK